MKTIFLLLLSLLPSFALAVHEIPCVGNQAEILRRTRFHAAVAADQVIRAMREELDRNNLSFNQRRKLNVAYSTLRCARGKLATLKFICGGGMARTAYTIPFFSSYVYIEPRMFFTGNELFPRTNLALYVHEASHHCGTTDAVYLNPGEKPRDGSIIGWQMIGDTYQYWVENGFCVPGRC